MVCKVKLPDSQQHDYFILFTRFIERTWTILDTWFVLLY